LVSEIDAAAINTYKERGYIVGPQLLNETEIALLRREFTRCFKGERDFDASPYEFARWQGMIGRPDSDLHLRKLNNSWWLNKTIRSVALSPVLGEMASILMNTKEVRLWHDQAIWKPGQDGAAAAIDVANVGWHQDYAHWQVSSTSNMCTAFIVLQDTDLSNGGLRTIPSSHKWGLLTDANTFHEKDLKKLAEEQKTKRAKLQHNARGGGADASDDGGDSRGGATGMDWQDEPTVLKAGQVAFHHALTIHGSGPNMSNAPRLALAVHMQPADCSYNGGPAWHQNLKDLGPQAAVGDLFQGRAWPVLWKNADESEQ
jgi:ectoine hydroxylase-related dioxygenase (phytanoyl-CoA dioxygenase family)